MAGNVFISYRRDDSAPWAGRLYERLARDFDRDQIFMDVDNIAPGLDFTKVLDQHVAKCDVLLAIIGSDWLSATKENGERRLDDPKDFVRIEVASALKRKIRVIPILVDGAKMPSANDLPPDLAPLAMRNAIEMRHAQFAGDAQQLVSALKSAVRPSKRSGGILAGGASQPTQSVQAIGAVQRAPHEKFAEIVLLLIIMPCPYGSGSQDYIASALRAATTCLTGTE